MQQHSVPHFPEEDSKLRATSLQVRRGGNCPNSLQVLAQLLSSDPQQRDQLTLHLLACLPDAGAPATRSILSSFGDEGNTRIDFSHCLFRAGHDDPASSYIIRSCEIGSRTIVNFNDLPEMTVEEFEKIANDFVEQGDECWWHFEVRHIRSSNHSITVPFSRRKPSAIVDFVRPRAESPRRRCDASATSAK